MKTEFVCREEQWMKRKIKESLMIKAHGNNLNLDAGAFIDTNWNPLPPSSSPLIRTHLLFHYCFYFILIFSIYVSIFYYTPSFPPG